MVSGWGWGRFAGRLAASRRAGCLCSAPGWRVVAGGASCGAGGLGGARLGGLGLGGLLVGGAGLAVECEAVDA